MSNLLSALYIKMNEFVYDKGYKNGSNDQKKEIYELKKLHEEDKKRMRYDHEIDLMELRKENEIMAERIRHDAKQVKITENEKLILRRREVHLEKQAEHLNDQLHIVMGKLATPFQSIFALTHEIQQDIKKNKKVGS